MPRGASYFIVPYAPGEAGPQVLLGKNQLFLTRPTTSQIIPDNAGQWAPIGGEAPSSQPDQTAAFKLFLDATGLNLADPDVARRYNLSAPQVTSLPPLYAEFTVFYLATDAAGLAALAADVKRNIGAGPTVTDGTLAEVEAVRVSVALMQRIGPVPPPPDGWAKFLVSNYFGGQVPGPFNTTYPILVGQLTSRSKDATDRYTLTLQQVPGGDGPSPPPPPTTVQLVELRVLGAERSRLLGSNLWYQAYSPGQTVTIQAVTDPPQPAAPPQILWQGGDADPTGLPQLRAVSLGKLTPFGQPTTVQATLGNTTKSVRVMVVPNLLRFDVSDAESLGDGRWGVDPDRRAIVRVVLEPNEPEAGRYLRWIGGEPCPDMDNRCRVVTVTDPRAELQLDVKVDVE